VELSVRDTHALVDAEANPERMNRLFVRNRAPLSCGDMKNEFL
jgi:hypothetical protein